MTTRTVLNSSLPVLAALAFCASGLNEAAGAGLSSTNRAVGISGPGTPVTPRGQRGWISGMAGLVEASPEKATGSVVKYGLFPPIKPLLNLHIRDTVIILGGDENYYMTGSTGDNIWGPYTNWQETVPCGGGTDFFRDKEGDWRCAFFGNDAAAPWREMPGIVRIEFDAAGKISVAKTQPSFILQETIP